MRVKLHLSYDGTSYYGWQKQKDPQLKTIQSELENALFSLCRLKPKTQGSGRTDRGVHALDQVVHFDLPEDFNFSNFDWVRGLNRYLLEDIRVWSASLVSSDFHATRSALSKAYIYQIQDGCTPNPLISRYTHCVSQKLNLEYLKEISKPLIGTHDFSSFQSVGTELFTPVRTLNSIEWIRKDEHLVEFHISGSGFLKQMVRNILGTLLHQYWLKPFKKTDLVELLDQKDRTKAFGTAPAKGLTLSKVIYPKNLTLSS